jgi:hypothetical protein
MLLGLKMTTSNFGLLLLYKMSAKCLQVFKNPIIQHIYILKQNIENFNMIGMAWHSFYKVILRMNIPLGGNGHVIPFQARFKFLRDLIVLSDSMMLTLKLFTLRSKVSSFSNLDKLSKPIVNVLKK